MNKRIWLIILMFCTLLAAPALAFYLEPRIIGGEDADEGDVPWQVAVTIDADDVFSFQTCGGTIVDANWVVSAAHCFVEDDGNAMDDSFYIAAGILNLSAATASDVIAVSHIAVHPDYNVTSTGFEHDIALLKLDEPLSLDQDLRRRIDWLSPAQTDLEAPGTPAVVSGWGSTAENPDDGEYPDELQMVDLELLDCNITDYGAGQITNNMLCAAGPELDYSLDSCVGDSGGPLVVQDGSGTSYLAGVVSFGPALCATDGEPGVYTRVSQYADWLQETMDNGGESSMGSGGASGGSGSSGGGGSSSSGSMANPATWLMLVLLGGLALFARWKTGNPSAGGRS